jgi:hypothetical protein
MAYSISHGSYSFGQKCGSPTYERHVTWQCYHQMGLCTRVHMHCIHKCYYVGTLIQKWKCEVEQHLYGTVAVVCSGNAWVCQVELCETLGDYAVQYCAIARWVQACNV